MQKILIVEDDEKMTNKALFRKIRIFFGMLLI